MIALLLETFTVMGAVPWLRLVGAGQSLRVARSYALYQQLQIASLLASASPFQGA